jgi:hypothetical protein
MVILSSLGTFAVTGVFYFRASSAYDDWLRANGEELGHHRRTVARVERWLDADLYSKLDSKTYARDMDAMEFSKRIRDKLLADREELFRHKRVAALRFKIGLVAALVLLLYARWIAPPRY